MHNELSGIVVIDKPAGITSAKAVAAVKRILGAAKVGHTGTLDPFATGVLLCCINQATRLAGFFLHGDKHYEARLRLGSATDTLDGTGRVMAQHPVPETSAEGLTDIFKKFEGPQLQQPPVYSALKHQGVPLYKLARRGQPVQKPPRPVNIKALRIRKVALPDVDFEMTCSAGTYVRVLCAQIGEALGCGGHLAELRRTVGSGFGINEAVSLETLRTMADELPQPQVMISMAEALRGMPVFKADAQILQRLAHGQLLVADHIPGHAIERQAPNHLTPYVKVVDDGNRLRAVLQWSEQDAKYNYCCVFN